MQLIEDIDSFNNNGLALTIGFFDGVHVGHRFLLEQLQNIANKENLQSAILTFWPHPRIVLNEEYKPLMINDWDEKVTLLNNTTLDICIKTAFTKSLANFTAFEFIKDVLVDKLNVKHLLIGYDHRFGKNREKGFDDYCKYGEILGVKVTKAESYSENENKISSSFIRRLLLTGNVKKVSHLLGYNYTIRGVVVPGFKIGRTINFPTANIDLQFKYKALPKSGAYAVFVYIDGNRYGGMLYIGNRPTLSSDGKPSIEVNVFDFDKDIYGKNIEVSFVDFIREQTRFEDVESLKLQLSKDRESAKYLLNAIL